MARLVVDGNGDGAAAGGVHPLGFILLVAGREEGVEVFHGPVHHVGEVAAAALHPLLLEVAGGHGRLVGLGAHRRPEAYPVGIGADVSVLAGLQVVDAGHAGLGFEAVVFAVLVAADFGFFAVAQAGQVAVVDKCAVVHDVGVGARAEEAALLVIQVEGEGQRVAGGQGPGQAVEAEAQGSVVQGQCGLAGRAQHEAAHARVLLDGHAHNHRIQRLRVLVHQHELATKPHGAGARENVGVEAHGRDAGLRHVLVAAVLLLVGQLLLFAGLGAEVLVQHVGVVEDVAAGAQAQEQAQRQCGAAAGAPAAAGLAQAATGVGAAHPE